MRTLLATIDLQIERFFSTLKRFPLASLSALVMTMIALLLAEYSWNQNHPNSILLSKIIFVSSLGLVLFPALQLITRNILFPLLGVLGLVAYFYYLPANLEEANETIFIRHFLIFLSLFFMIFWAPFVARKSNNMLFWQYAQSLIFGLLSALFFAFLLYAGLAIALSTIETLFDVIIDSKRYTQVGILIFGIFAYNFFLSQIPKHPLFLETPPYSKIKRLFSKSILAPLALLYFVILFAYSAKILITLSWPESTLSWIIVSFCIIAILSFLFLTPYLQKSSKAQRLIWFAIFLQTLMLGLALWIRVEEYGITYNRYLLGLFGAWTVLMSLLFMLLGRHAHIKWIFITASLFILLSQVGPYSANSITQKDQTERLIKLIETAHPRSEALNNKTKYEISNAIDYLYTHFGIEAFENIVPHIYQRYQSSNQEQSFPQYATEALGFGFIDRWRWKEIQANGINPLNLKQFQKAYDGTKYVKVQGYEWLVDFYYDAHPNPKKRISLDKNIHISFENNHFKIQDHNQTLGVIDLSYYAKQLIEEEKSSEPLSSERLSFLSHHGKVAFKINFNTISIQKSGAIQQFSATLLLSTKEH